ncbi:SEC14-like protein 2 [Argiope bruennichi]|uniref:SEC14-like protein 2 n=1 Tax=Argiope bruennichi TaxID=94029 RepID=UPI002493F188|nr:SEC14-like protein 2 [Argiope bruennichi]XP_055931810.1 SEC14-like protein 2 [Argiope bruennichi]XP_055931811.1 SEC14-like protein 2 [Argiope bruennichi]XP_055931812.1 SEC14-like protein 2 [Argiope bruennichi]
MISEEDYTVEEKEAIEKLREKIPKDQERDLYDDTYRLYLFLKDHNFNITEAENMLTKMLKWRQKVQINKIQEFKPPEVVEKYFEKNLIGFAKNGAPVHYLPLGKFDSKGIIMSTKHAELEKIYVRMLEKDIVLLRKLKKPPKESYPGGIYIYDMDQLTFANATDKKAIEYMIKYFKVCQDFYPGMIDVMYVINISSYFMIPLSIAKSCLSADFISLVQFHGTDGWREELLKIIDDDQLPAFLGGKRTDPDGNPLCKTIVVQGGKIDEKHYIHKSKSSLVNAPGVEKITLARASFSEIELEVNEDGSLIEWEFETKTRDIGFGLFYKEIVSGEEKITELVPLLRIDTEDYSETGVYRCERAGTYVVLFDNSYSWLRSKEIYYRIKIVNSEKMEKETQN